MAGVTNSVLPTLSTSGANASLGALAGVIVEVTHGSSAPVAAVVHPAGSAGAVTPSKFSAKVAVHGGGVGVGPPGQPRIWKIWSGSVGSIPQLAPLRP